MPDLLGNPTPDEIRQSAALQPGVTAADVGGPVNFLRGIGQGLISSLNSPSAGTFLTTAGLALASGRNIGEAGLLGIQRVDKESQRMDIQKLRELAAQAQVARLEAQKERIRVTGEAAARPKLTPAVKNALAIGLEQGTDPFNEFVRESVLGENPVSKAFLKGLSDNIEIDPTAGAKALGLFNEGKFKEAFAALPKKPTTVTQPAKSDLIDETGNLKVAAGNSLTRELGSLFGGTFDASGNIVGLNQAQQERLGASSAIAASLIINGVSKSTPEAAQKAFEFVNQLVQGIDIQTAVSVLTTDKVKQAAVIEDLQASGSLSALTRNLPLAPGASQDTVDIFGSIVNALFGE